MGTANYIIDENKIWNDAKELMNEMGLDFQIIEIQPSKDFDTKITEWICISFLILTIITLIL